MTFGISGIKRTVRYKERLNCIHQHNVFSDVKETNKSKKQERQTTNNETTTKKGNS